jgi:DNA end-binding protein Ku
VSWGYGNARNGKHRGMPRAIWSGSISFGLVNVPVRMYSAIDERDVRFHLLHEKDDARIGYEKVCKKEDKPVPDDEIVRGYEVSEGEYVYVTDEDLEAAAGEKYRSIDIRDFVAVEEVDPIYFERTSYLGPAEGGEKPYALLVRAMEEAGLVGIATYVARDKQQLGCLRVRDGMIVLERMFFADEIRPTKGIVPRKGSVPKEELRMALDLIERFRSDFEPERYEDTYRAALLGVIDRKRKGKDVHVEPETEQEEEPTDLLEALRASVEAHGRRGRSTKRRNGSLRGVSRDELDRRARKAGIRGRSKMSKTELAKALQRAS